MAYPVLAPRNEWYKSSSLRNTITKIAIVDSYTPTGSENETWNADKDNQGSIKCYRVGTELVLAGNGSGGIYMNPDSYCIFGSTDNTENNGFTNVQDIHGLNLLDASQVTSLFKAFNFCYKVTSLDIGGWNVSKVVDMAAMFQCCYALLSVSFTNWDTSTVTRMNHMFNQCSVITDLNVSMFDVSSCQTLKSMFQNCKAVQELDISSWDTSLCTDMSYMFANCYVLRTITGISDMDTSACTDMAYMFYGCKQLASTTYSPNFTLDLHTRGNVWNVSKVTNMSTMFACPASSGGYGWTGYMSNLDVSGWDVSSCTNMNNMFSAQGKLVEIVGFNTWKGTSACTDMGWMFWTCSSLKKIDLSNFDTRNVVSFHHLFAHCSQLKEIIGLENLDVSSAVTVNAMLHSTRIEKLDISKWNTSKVEDFTQFLEYASALTEIIGLEKIDTSSVRSCQQMFQGCTKLKRLNLSTFNTTKITGKQVDESGTYWKDPYRPNNDDFGSMTAMFGSEGISSSGEPYDYRTRSLREIIIGPNFSFEGSGNLKDYGAQAKLFDPDPEFISGTRGVWYNVDTLESYTSSELPNNIAATYTCVGVDVLVKHTTLLDIASEVNRINGSTSKLKPSEMVSILSTVSGGNIKEISSALDSIILQQDEVITS